MRPRASVRKRTQVSRQGSGSLCLLLGSSLLSGGHGPVRVLLARPTRWLMVPGRERRVMKASAGERA